MARISLGVLVAEARGKVGGGVFSRTRSGNVLRVRVSPRNPRSQQQSNVRTYLTEAAQKFKVLTGTQLAAWNTYAASLTKHNPTSGQSYAPSAINVFSGLAAKFLQVTPGGTIPVTPPSTPFNGDTLTVVAAGGAGTVTFTGSADNGAGITTEVLLQPLKSANRVPSAKGYRSEAFSAVPHGTPVAVTHLQADYLHPSSPIPAGSYVPAYRFVKTATGQESPLVVLPAVIVT